MGTSEGGTSPIYYADGNDIQGAIEAARETFRYFVREMSWERRRIVPAMDLKAAKAVFFDDPNGPVEHMWVAVASLRWAFEQEHR